MAELTPFALKDAPALIEAVFPAQKVSFEAQTERKAGRSQTLTGLGSFWKGRKPLILVRSIVLGSLLPQTDDHEKDLEIFEALMGFDNEALARRALIKNAFKPKDFSLVLTLDNPWKIFSYTIKSTNLNNDDVETWSFPIDSDMKGIALRWQRDATEEQKLLLYRKVLENFDSYEKKASICKRPEELDQEWLYAKAWSKVNRHYAHLGIKAFSHQELIEQLGILRYGKRPRVGDTFSGGGSIPFEAARLGCDVHATDLNPVACMLTWGAFNVIGAGKKERKRIEEAQDQVCQSVEDEICELGIEHDAYGNRAKAFLYCLETECPETGWKVPLAPTWIINKTRKVVAILVPNHEKKKFDIQVKSNVSKDELEEANTGTIQNGSMVYTLDGITHRVPIKTLRGDYKGPQRQNLNRLRLWEKTDFKPQSEDLFQDRLYAIQWYTAESAESARKESFFSSVTEYDLAKEQEIEEHIAKNLQVWQQDGLIPNMEIESGYNTDQPVRERGWTHWHHLFYPRQLLMLGLIAKRKNELGDKGLCFTSLANRQSKLCRWQNDGRKGGLFDTFDNQALNTLYNGGARSFVDLKPYILLRGVPSLPIECEKKIACSPASEIDDACSLWITDPPYADAVHYHEITEYFIAWLRKNPPKPFDEWTWDSRRALAIKGSGDDFRKGMVGAYKAMANHMPDNGMQCVMFTHQDTGVWSDMIGIFWAAGLQVVGAWYIATETSSELKKGGYVQGTVILMLRKRPAGENAGFKQRLLPAVRAEVKNQIETMMHLNSEVKDKMGEPVFNDSDLQMAGYAAALKVLTSYTHIGGEDVTTFALRPRTRGETTVVDEIVQQAAEAANSLLVPEGLSTDTWQKLSGIQRFYLRMMDIETTGAAKLDNYQNFAKAFRVEDHSRVMGSMAANKAQLKRIPEFASRDLTESNEIGSTWLGHLIIGLQQLLAETDPQAVISQLQADLPDFMEIRALLIDVLTFVENKAPEKETRDVAEVLGARLKNMRALGN